MYQLQNVIPASGAGAVVYTTVYMRSPVAYLGVVSGVPATTPQLFTAVIQKAYTDANPTATARFSGQLFNLDNNANFPDISTMGNVWQMPGLAFFVPSTPVVGPPALGLNTTLNWGSLGCVTAPFETLLMAKKRAPGYNPAQTGRASVLNPAPANPWGSLFLNALVGQNGFLPVDYRSHTERQLVAALLNGIINHGVTAGDLYVYTEENTCTDSTPHPHNQGISCIKFLEGLRDHFKNINFHVFFKNFNGKFLNNLSLDEVRKLLDFITDYTGSPNDFSSAFPYYRIIHNELMTNNSLYKIYNILNLRTINDVDFAKLKSILLTRFKIDIDLLNGAVVDLRAINAAGVSNRIRLAIKARLVTSPTSWRLATPVEINHFIVLLSNYIVVNAIATQPFAMYLKNEIFQKVFGKPGITYYYLQ